MNKKSLHFKIASWSVKHPNSFYIWTGGILVAILCSAIGLTWLSTTRVPASPFVSTNQVEQVAVPQKDGWTIRKSATMQNGQLCVLYRSNESYTQITQCYTPVRGKWVFDMSY